MLVERLGLDRRLGLGPVVRLAVEPVLVPELAVRLGLELELVVELELAERQARQVQLELELVLGLVLVPALALAAELVDYP